ncbi:MarR family winged helix-turn-helix transcriptional regulator [Flavobacterium sp.]|uniref:MarR family winged helix-turn-helix transcriptional regulator n=1 Tax=Flavobacterium sp. TaxID=239 RepID=UPI0039E4A90D
MSIFNLHTQNHDLEHKIAAGLERLSQVFKTLLWEKAKTYGLSPIQIQLLIFIRYHSPEKTTVSYLAKECNVTKSTVSDAIKVLEQKGLIAKTADASDSRSYTMALTGTGQQIVSETEDFADPIAAALSKTDASEKEIIWKNLSGLIASLNRAGVISVQRNCQSCVHYAENGNRAFCKLLQLPLETKDLRIDCPEFEQAV